MAPGPVLAQEVGRVCPAAEGWENEPFIERGVQAQTNAPRAWRRTLREPFSRGISGVNEPFNGSPIGVSESFGRGSRAGAVSLRV
jgi:hypothetical protein